MEMIVKEKSLNSECHAQRSIVHIWNKARFLVIPKIKESIENKEEVHGHMLNISYAQVSQLTVLQARDQFSWLRSLWFMISYDLQIK